MKFRIISFFLLLTIYKTSQAQDLDQLLTQATGDQTQYTTATFKSTRIISGHSIERMQAGQLDFRISHKFGQLNTGSYNLWGLDGPATIHFSLEYGITNWVMVGVGRGSYEKTYDGFLKFSLLRQSTGKRNMPVSVSFLTTSAINSLNMPASFPFWSRVSYVEQVLIARKFNERFSFEINPTFVHRNIVATQLDPNDLLSAGFGARFKLSNHVTLNAEYYYVFHPMPKYESLKTYNPLSIGFDIETGGHVFQLFITNSESMIEKGFIGETTGNWKNGGIRFGFNISRVFTLKKYNH
jgi:hypothetical protein